MRADDGATRAEDRGLPTGSIPLALVLDTDLWGAPARSRLVEPSVTVELVDAFFFLFTIAKIKGTATNRVHEPGGMNVDAR